MADNKNPVLADEVQGSCRNERIQTIGLSLLHKEKVVNTLASLHSNVSDFLQDIDSEHYPIDYIDIYSWVKTIHEKTDELLDIYLANSLERKRLCQKKSQKK